MPAADDDQHCTEIVGNDLADPPDAKSFRSLGHRRREDEQVAGQRRQKIQQVTAVTRNAVIVQLFLPERPRIVREQQMLGRILSLIQCKHAEHIENTERHLLGDVDAGMATVIIPTK